MSSHPCDTGKVALRQVAAHRRLIYMGNAILVSGQVGCSLRVAAHSDFTCAYTCTENFNISAQELLIVITFFCLTLTVRGSI